MRIRFLDLVLLTTTVSLAASQDPRSGSHNLSFRSKSTWRETVSDNAAFNIGF